MICLFNSFYLIIIVCKYLNIFYRDPHKKSLGTNSMDNCKLSRVILLLPEGNIHIFLDLLQYYQKLIFMYVNKTFN